MNVTEPSVAVPAADAEDLAAVLGTLEDWLLHASNDTRDELADFTGRSRVALTMLIDELGHQAVRLRRALATSTDKDTNP